MYYVMFGFLAMCSLFEASKNKKSHSLVKRSNKNTALFVIIALIMICMSAFRGALGTDYNTNQRYFNSLHTGSATLKQIEPFYFLLVNFTNTYNVFILVIAVIAISTKLKLIYEKSDYVFVSLLVYYSYMFFQFDMGIIRQGLALSFTLWASIYIEKKDFKKFVLLSIVAVFCHYSALIFLIAYPIANRVYSRPIIYGVSLVCLVLSFTDFWKIISVVLSILARFGLSKYTWYLTNEAFRANSFEFLDLQRIIMLIFFTEFIKRKSDDKKSEVYLNLYFISTVLYYLFRTFSAISSRGAYYYVAFEIFMFSDVLKYLKSASKRMILVLFIIGYCGIYMYKVLNQYSVEDYYNIPYIPYSSWLFG